MKKYNLLFVFVAVLLLPIRVFALNGSIAATCTPNPVGPGATLDCRINITTDEAISSIDVPFSVSNASVVGFTKNAEFWAWDDTAGNGKLENSVRADKSDQVVGEVLLGTLSLKVNDNATGNVTLSFHDGIFNANWVGHSIPDSSVSIPISGPKGLTNLQPTVGYLGPQFTTSGTAYVLTLPATTTTFGFNLTPAVSSDAITINSVNGALNSTNITYQDSGGSMYITIVVGTGDRQVTYGIGVIREQSSGSTTTSEPKLISLSVAGQNASNISDTMTFELSDVSNYQVVARLNDSTNYQFDASASGSGCSATGGTLTCQYTSAGTHSIKIVSKTSGGASKTYSLVIKKISSGSTPSGSGSTPSNPSTPSSGSNVPTNPRTGNFVAACFMALMLVASLTASAFLYKKNMKNFNN